MESISEQIHSRVLEVQRETLVERQRAKTAGLLYHQLGQTVDSVGFKSSLLKHNEVIHFEGYEEWSLDTIVSDSKNGSIRVRIDRYGTRNLVLKSVGCWIYEINIDGLGYKLHIHPGYQVLQFEDGRNELPTVEKLESFTDLVKQIPLQS